MTGSVPDRIIKFTEEGLAVSSRRDFDQWQRRLFGFLSAVLDNHELEVISNLGRLDAYQNWEAPRDRQVNYLEGMILRHLSEIEEQDKESADKGDKPRPLSSKRVFVVHGHDESAKESVARFLDNLHLTPVILHEQPNQGDTVIEKFERHADVRFAVVLLTPDDIGGASDVTNDQRPRARQNVILELGYFIGRLGRKRVCALYKEGVEIPTDYQGVLYVPFDSLGGWRTKLAQELISAGVDINVEGLLS